MLIQHQVNCLWKLNCFGFICWSCQSLALLYPTQCCLYLFHWWLHIELLSSFKYGFKRIWEVLESTEELIYMQASNMVLVGCFCSSPSYLHKLFSFCLSSRKWSAATFLQKQRSKTHWSNIWCNNMIEYFKLEPTQKTLGR